jgi:hypothetical protein
MATTTPNFGWPVPTSTDLVKDGATAIEALGDGIDTSMVDLKGGTTGQILAKATNADMDFAWITNDVGDITAVTAGTGITGGGTSGSVTVSFDQANFGGGQFAAGKNKFINGDFSVNQRNFVSSTTSAEYNFDRYRTIYTGGTSTTSAQVFTLGAAPVVGYEGKNFYRVAITGQSAVGDSVRVQQNIESVRTFAGQTVTVSFWAKADSGTPKIALLLLQSFGQGGSPSAGVDVLGGTVTISTSWARYSLTVAIPSIAGKTLGTTDDGNLSARFFLSGGSSITGAQSIGIQNATFDMWGLQIESGSIATPFQTTTGNIQAELAACQRYYYRNNAAGTATYYANSSANNTTNFLFQCALPVQMRIVPNILDYSNIRVEIPGTNTYTSGTWALSGNSTPANPNISYTHGSAVFTANLPGNLSSSSASSYLGFSAEF